MGTNIEALKICEVSVSYKSKVKASERPKLISSKDVYNVLQLVYDPETIELKEYFKVILLNQASKVLGVHHLSEGGIDATLADIRQIMQIAILTNATSIIVSHNHPSGNLQPSQEDKRLTEKISQACKFMNICLLDHVIVTAESYFSFADEGLV